MFPCRWICRQRTGHRRSLGPRTDAFRSCYIGGWTAAHHWELTEQLFNETLVFTTRRVTEKRVTAQGAVFVLHNIKPKRLFGLKTLWRGSVKVSISDAARTLVDMIAAPEVGGGIDHVADCLSAYLGSKTADRDLLIRYAEQFDNGAVFKRLGYLAETRLHDKKLAAECRSRLTQGYARLDPALPSRNSSPPGGSGCPPLEKSSPMIDRREILEAASSFSLLPSVVEKDYVLGWILAGINAHEELSESWVFKGGTCLKKCYFETYRFSEDLDFTLRDEESP